MDEVQRILYYIRENASLGRAYKVTDELFDLSTMAMEYFKEHIEPTLPEITFFGAEFLDFTTPFTSKLHRTLTFNTNFEEKQIDKFFYRYLNYTITDSCIHRSNKKTFSEW